MRRGRRSRRAGGPGRGPDAGVVEQEQQRLGVDVVDQQVRGPRQPRSARRDGGHHPGHAAELGLEAVWSRADAGLASFALPAPADYLARNPNQMFDFSLTNTYSDLDLTRIEAGVNLRYEVSKRLSLLGEYRWIDLDDEAPYLGDLTGSVSLYSIAVGYRF